MLSQQCNSCAANSCFQMFSRTRQGRDDVYARSVCDRQICDTASKRQPPVYVLGMYFIGDYDFMRWSIIVTRVKRLQGVSRSYRKGLLIEHRTSKRRNIFVRSCLDLNQCPKAWNFPINIHRYTVVCYLWHSSFTLTTIVDLVCIFLKEANYWRTA